MSPHRVAVVAAALAGALLLLVACGGHPAAGSASRHHAGGSQAAPARLAWKVGETFTGAVTFDERDHGAVDDELRFTAREQFHVIRSNAGAATIRVEVMSWRWQRNTSELLTTSRPAPFRFVIKADGEIVSGVDWPLPSDLPLPGLDLFAAPLTTGAGWTRTDGEGAAVSYRGTAGTSPGATALDWSVVRPQFTTSGDPFTVSGRAEATISSRYRRHRATVTLRSTREQATFARTTESAGGTVEESGTVLDTTVFHMP